MPTPAVPHHDEGRRALPPHLHGDRRAASAVLDGVADDVLEHAREAAAVPRHPQGRRRRGDRDRRGPAALRPRPLRHLVGHRARERAQVHVVHVEVERLAQLQAGHVVELVHRGEQAPGGRGQGSKLRRVPGRVEAPAASQARGGELGAAQDVGQGGAQVVGGHSQEIVAHPYRRLRRSARLPLRRQDPRPLRRQLLDQPPRPHLLRHVDGMSQDARHGALCVAHGLIREAEEDVLQASVAGAVEPHEDLRAHERLAGPVDRIEQLVDALARQLGEGGPHRLADQVGDIAPVRTIAGPRTRLAGADALILAAGNVVVANDPHAQDIKDTHAQGDIGVFAPTARGDSAPARTIGGLGTGLYRPSALAAGGA